MMPGNDGKTLVLVPDDAMVVLSGGMRAAIGRLARPGTALSPGQADSGDGEGGREEALGKAQGDGSGRGGAGPCGTEMVYLDAWHSPILP
jgi:hypothetical protein